MAKITHRISRSITSADEFAAIINNLNDDADFTLFVEIKLPGLGIQRIKLFEEVDVQMVSEIEIDANKEDT